MSVYADNWIKEKATNGMISPFVNDQVKDGGISYGLSSYGYDARLADEFRIFTNTDNVLVDPKNFLESAFVEKKGKECISRLTLLC